MDSRFKAIYSKLKQCSKSWKTPAVSLLSMQQKDPFKTLVSAVLSSRTKDTVTVTVIDKLFKIYPDFQSLSEAKSNDLLKQIYPVGFYQVKSKHLIQLSKKIIKHYDGKVPDQLDDLLTLPGVGRKTANLVLSLAFDKPAICVDVHVHRIMNRLEFVKSKTPFETEKQLTETLPEKYWIGINRIFVSFGQTICLPRKPKCLKCLVNQYCPVFLQK